MKTIGIFTSDYGHQSIADAVKEKIEAFFGKQVSIKMFHQKIMFEFVYNSMYRLNPSAMGSSFRATVSLLKKEKSLKKIVETFFLSKNEKKIRSFVKKNKIDLCISSYFPYNPALEKIQTEKKIPFINIYTDPKTIHPLMNSEFAQSSLVFDEKTQTYGLIHPAQIAGWFVREKFEKKLERADLRKKLNIADQLTVLLASGSEGANAILKILPSIINCDRAVTFIIVCGNNAFLYHSALGIKKTLESLSSSKAVLIPIGFTKDLHLYMQASDLIVGKAGPNTLFESVACEVPFFAITHIHGQEDGNLDIIRDYKLGFVEENANKANQKLRNILKKPEKLKAFLPHIKKLKEHNQKSGEVLVQEIQRLLDI